MRLMRVLFLVLFTLWFAGSARAGELTGQVIGVLDGDTIEVLHNTHPERLRLAMSRCDIDGWGKGV
jgi:endonuclease YncB( thermonuclease family)